MRHRALNEQQARNLVKESKTQSTKELSAKYGITTASVLNYIHRAGGSSPKVGRPSGRADQPKSECPTSGRSPKESWEYVGHKCNVTVNQTRIHTEEELIEYFKIDTNIWEIERFVANKWEVGMKPAATTEWVESNDGRKIPMWVRDDDKPIVIPLYQVKATFVKKKVLLAAKNELLELKKLAKSSFPIVKPRPRPASSGNMLEINIPDIHIGKLAWGGETGGPNYDSKIARDLYREAREGLLARMNPYKFDQILYVVGNDMLNSDSPSGTTTQGTHVDNDSRYHKTFAMARNLVIESVERLLEIAPVKVVLVSGNHDERSMWHLGDSLECMFHRHQEVSIDNTPRVRKYHQHGQVMVMLTHGDKGKRLEYPLIMAAEQPQMWGSTRFREAHTGHLHKTKVEEQNGVRVRVLSALCPIDAWHTEMGFIGALRQAESFAWNDHEGLIGTAVYHAADNPNDAPDMEPLHVIRAPRGASRARTV